MSKSYPKNQHYVPMFLLRNFTFNEDQVFAFDKKTERVFPVNIRNIAAEQKFYDIEVDEHVVSIEQSLSEVEARAADVIQKLLYKEDINALVDSEKMLLASFIAIQIQRGKHVRENLTEMSRLLEDFLRKEGADPYEVENFTPLSEDGVKQVAISLVQDYEQLIPYILNKWWLLLRTPITRPYYISDNPVVLQNMIDHGLRGNLGLAVTGIEVYLPLSKTITLALYCKSHEEFIRDSFEKKQQLRRQNNSSLHKKKNKKSYQMIQELWSVLQSGKALQTKEINLINANSLQVAYASRFVFSYSNDFKLAEEMIREKPQLKTGPKVSVILPRQKVVEE